MWRNHGTTLTETSALMLKANPLRSYTRSALAVFMVIAGWLLLFEQQVHVSGNYLLPGALVGLSLLVSGWLHLGLKRIGLLGVIDHGQR